MSPTPDVDLRCSVALFRQDTLLLVRRDRAGGQTRVLAGGNPEPGEGMACCDRVAAVAPPDRRRPLLEVVDEALALQADADAFIRAVAAGQRVDSRLIRQGGRLASVYLQLRRQAKMGRPPAAVAGQLDAQLNYHHQMVEQMVEAALQLADTRGRPNAERQRRRLRGLGSAARGLPELRARLAPDADETGVEGAVAGRAD